MLNCGFSQGAAVAFYFACNSGYDLAGCIILSGWLPLNVSKKGNLNLSSTPIYVAHGLFNIETGLLDNVVSIEYAIRSISIAKGYNFQVNEKFYPNLKHNWNDEILLITTPSDMIDRRNNILRIVQNVDFPSLIQQQNDRSFMNGLADEPFYVCDLGDILSKHKLWNSRLPRVEPFYALKCNPDPLVLRILSKLGLGFDCASRSEIAQVLDEGVSPSRILYANPCKHPSYITYAANNNIQYLVFDSAPELQKIAVYHPTAELILRLFVGASKARCPLGLKFGAFIHEVPQLLKAALSLNLNVVGISFHVGSGCFDPEAYKEAIILSHIAFNEAQKLGISLSLLDIGGGFPGNLSSSDKLSFFEEVCDTINSTLDAYFPVNRGVRIVAEPGRYYVSSAYNLSCNVTSVRPIHPTASDPGGFSYFLNDGVYGSFNCTYFDHYIGDHYLLDDHFNDQNKERDQTTHPSIFWGPSCDSMDKILENFSIRKLKIGDCIVFRDMGAYTMAASSTFNGFERPYVVYYSSYVMWSSLEPLLGDFPIETVSEVDTSFDISDDYIIFEENTKMNAKVEPV